MDRAPTLLLLAATLLFSAGPLPAVAAADEDTVPLAGTGDDADDRVLEAMLAPGEFPRRRFEFSVAGDEALFVLDASLGAEEPRAEVDPSRVAWPRVAGLALEVEGGPRRLLPVREGVGDADLDAGISVRFTLAPLGQRFNPAPRFATRLEAVEVLSAKDGRALLAWRAVPAPRTCAAPTVPGGPDCDLAGVSLEARAVSLSPDGSRLALAVGGLRPRVEVYDLEGDPRRTWQSLFPTRSGGPVEVAFSADGSYLAVLTGTGGLHRFNADTGGGHLAIPSTGRTARGLPPGHLMAVAGAEGEVTLWYLEDGTIAWRLPPRKVRGPVARLAASGDGRRLATLDYEEAGTVVRVWDIADRALTAQIGIDPYAVADIALDTDGSRLFASHERRGLLVVEIDGDRRPLEAGGTA
ncbi:MAG TPA: hypothetical protein VM285_08435, partial [Polyangia bacterium]|nr:hypothetical protein [Polyangia bacterium]